MAFKFVVFAAALAYANAGLLGAPAVATYSAAPAVSSSYIHQAAPVVSAYSHAPVVQSYAQAPVLSTYAHAPVAVHAPAIGSSQQSVVRSLGGSVSTYSKAVDSAFSSVRKYDTRITNNGLAVAHAPVLSSYAAPVVSSYAHAAPVVSAYSHAPVVSSYAHAAPVVSSYAHAAPVVSAYSHAPVVSSYAHASPVVSAYSAPAIVTKSAAVAYSPATVVSHASFSGLGAQYAW